MLNLAISLRALQLYAHQAHHLCARTTFIQDHEFFSEVYKFADGAYDSIIERIIGLKGKEAVSLKLIVSGLSSKLSNVSDTEFNDNKQFYIIILGSLNHINSAINVICKQEDTSEGTKQLIGNLADQIEVLIYKIKQRIL